VVVRSAGDGDQVELAVCRVCWFRCLLLLDALGYDTGDFAQSAESFHSISDSRYALLAVEQERKYRQALRERFMDFGAGDPRD
jgi:hypothetical protein